MNKRKLQQQRGRYRKKHPYGRLQPKRGLEISSEIIKFLETAERPMLTGEVQRHLQNIISPQPIERTVRNHIINLVKKNRIIRIKSGKGQRGQTTLLSIKGEKTLKYPYVTVNTDP